MPERTLQRPVVMFQNCTVWGKARVSGGGSWRQGGLQVRVFISSFHFLVKAVGVHLVLSGGQSRSAVSVGMIPSGNTADNGVGQLLI